MIDLIKYKVIDYKVIWGRDLNTLEPLVNAKIKEGYVPLGGVSITVDYGSCQAVVKVEPK